MPENCNLLKQTNKPRVLELKNTYYIISNIADAFSSRLDIKHTRKYICTKQKGWEVQKTACMARDAAQLVECLLSNAGSPGFSLQHCREQVQWHKPLSPAPERWRQEDQKYRSLLTTQRVEASLGHIRTWGGLTELPVLVPVSPGSSSCGGTVCSVNYYPCFLS